MKAICIQQKAHFDSCTFPGHALHTRQQCSSKLARPHNLYSPMSLTGHIKCISAMISAAQDLRTYNTTANPRALTTGPVQAQLKNCGVQHFNGKITQKGNNSFLPKQMKTASTALRKGATYRDTTAPFDKDPYSQANSKGHINIFVIHNIHTDTFQKIYLFT